MGKLLTECIKDTIALVSCGDFFDVVEGERLWAVHNRFQPRILKLHGRWVLIGWKGLKFQKYQLLFKLCTIDDFT